MALYTSSAGVGGILPDDYGNLVIQPVVRNSIFAQVATIVVTDANEYRVPVVEADVTAGWFAEGQEISPSDPTLNELVLVPRKVAALTTISEELANDSDPNAAEIVGGSIARALVEQIDRAAFTAAAAPAPAGLSTLTGIQSYTGGAATFQNLDFAAEAISKAETVGATITSFVTSPATALALAKIKEASGSNKPVLGSDPTQPTSRNILGVPLLVSPYIAANTLWAVDRSRLYFVVRQGATVEADRSVYFTSDRVAIKGKMRATFGFVHPASVVKVTLA